MTAQRKAGAPTTAGPTVDDMLTRAGRWVLAKVWLGCMLSGAYALGRHFGWPQALLTVTAGLGALVLAVAVAWLPLWTHDRPSGVALVDVGLRVLVWAGLAGSVVALLIGVPAVGTAAGALLLVTAWHTFRRPSPPARCVQCPRCRAIAADPRRRTRRPGAQRGHADSRITRSAGSTTAGSMASPPASRTT
jgi:hypothetical protein